jgi:hypothetical protein
LNIKHVFSILITALIKRAGFYNSINISSNVEQIKIGAPCGMGVLNFDLLYIRWHIDEVGNWAQERGYRSFHVEEKSIIPGLM